jgi:hypothetical protein
MRLLARIFGPPHELLHLLALLLIGRRPLAFTWTHIDIPGDLSARQYVIVAGLPALVFWGMALLGVGLLLNAADVRGLLLGFALLLVGGLAGWGTLGDLYLIAARLSKDADERQ